MNQTEPCPSCGYPPYLLSSGVADKPDRENYWSAALVLGGGGGGLGPSFFFLFHRTIFIPPSCRWVSLEHGAQN